MEPKIPEKGEIVQITDLRIDRNIGNVCTCTNPKRILNTVNRQVYCEGCGAIIDPFDALLDVVKRMKNSNHAVHQQYEQYKQLKNYKPWLKSIRYLEKQYRGKKMLPHCPRCSEPFYLEELNSWMGREFADARIRKWKEEQHE